MKNNKGRNLYKHLFIVLLPVLNLLKTRIFLYWRYWDTWNFGDGIQVDANLGFEILDCYHFDNVSKTTIF